MDNPEYCQLWAHEIEGAIKNGQSRALSTLGTRDWRSNQEWTIQSTVNFGHMRLKEQSRMDNPEHCQPWAHKTKTNKTKNTTHKKNQIRQEEEMALYKRRYSKNIWSTGFVLVLQNRTIRIMNILDIMSTLVGFSEYEHVVNILEKYWKLSGPLASPSPLMLFSGIALRRFY